MFLICEDNPKFEESGKLIAAANELGIKTFSDVVGQDCLDWYFNSQSTDSTQFTYGTRPFYHKNGWRSDMFCRQDYLYNYSFLMSFSSRELFSISPQIIPARNVGLGIFPNQQYFVRPNSGEKTFPGQVISGRTLQNGLSSLFHIDPWELVIRAEARKTPDKEYRFFFIRNNSTCTCYECCQYLPEQTNEVPEEIKEWTESQAERLFDFIPFGNSFVLDVCELDDVFYLLEINSWNSSSFYSINPKSILRNILWSLDV